MFGELRRPNKWPICHNLELPEQEDIQGTRGILPTCQEASQVSTFLNKVMLKLLKVPREIMSVHVPSP